MQRGDTPSVLAMSWGKGDMQRDDITIDNLSNQENQDELRELLDRRRPDVITIGGFSMATTKLMQRVKEFIGGTAPEQAPGTTGGWEQPQQHHHVYNIPVIYVQDEVARIYQHSKRADEEYGSLTPLAKYCVGLARYAQSPLNEYAAIGPDITAITFDEDNQPLVSSMRCICMLLLMYPYNWKDS
jgi:transcription elongation factor SPT6